MKEFDNYSGRVLLCLILLSVAFMISVVVPRTLRIENTNVSPEIMCKSYSQVSSSLKKKWTTIFPLICDIRKFHYV